MLIGIGLLLKATVSVLAGAVAAGRRW